MGINIHSVAKGKNEKVIYTIDGKTIEKNLPASQIPINIHAKVIIYLDSIYFVIIKILKKFILESRIK